MINFRLLGIKLGDALKYVTSINEINRVARAVFLFDVLHYPNDDITSSRAQLIFDWVMTLAEQPIEEKEKLKLLQQFIDGLTPDDPSFKNRIKEILKKNIDYFEMDFWSIIHKDIIRVSKNKFEDGYYADAVESAFKEVNKRVKDIVREKTKEELDGRRLMFKAFDLNKPIIKLSDLRSQTERDLQEGYMHIFAGSMQGIRNPKAHDNLNISRERAIHFIFLASLLMYKLDEAK